MDTLEPRPIYPTTAYLPITPPYEFREISQVMFEQNPLVNKTTDSKHAYVSDKPAWMASPDSSRFDDEFSEASSDSEKSLLDATLPHGHYDQDEVDSLEMSVPSKMRYKHQQAVTAIMNSNSHIPLKSAVAIANGLGRYRSGRKSIPHRSPKIVSDELHKANHNQRDLVFQIDMCNPANGIQHKSKVISGESLLMALKRRVTTARQAERKTAVNQRSNAKRMHESRHVSPTRIWLPKPSSPIHKKYQSRGHSEFPQAQRQTRLPSDDAMSEDDSSESASMDMDPEVETKPRERQPSGQFKPQGASPKSIKSKGPCQACQEHSEGCMRKAFGWPLSDSKVYYDKGRPFVYLCNKCGLRYNKSNGCVCRNCKWVLCKEDKRKAMQYIDAMRAKRPDGYLDPEEEIEGFLCPPKYWKCSQPWKVGWVLNNGN